ncbi:Katanin p60 ATPase-containing subunit A-like 2 [Nymphon striatum]|nr:Katanin p60 ATPase-containing subunit A-like 2 [Nymphon striatum]
MEYCSIRFEESSQFLNHKLKLLRGLREQDYIVGEPEDGQSIAIYGDSFRSPHIRFILQIVFELARANSPAIIFFDEIDCLGGVRSGRDDGFRDHEASRRLKTELMMQIDNLHDIEQLVFVLAASNVPWDLDHAILRRMEKRMLIELPNTSTRRAIIERHLPAKVGRISSHFENNSHQVLAMANKLDYDYLAENTDGYSGSDLRLLCKEAAMSSVRDFLENLHKSFMKANAAETQSIKPITNDVFITAKSKVSPSSSNQIQHRYEEWKRKFQAC